MSALYNYQNLGSFLGRGGRISSVIFLGDWSFVSLSNCCCLLFTLHDLLISGYLG
jgi:hypothetical protein